VCCCAAVSPVPVGLVPHDATCSGWPGLLLVIATGGRRLQGGSCACRSLAPCDECRCSALPSLRLLLGLPREDSRAQLGDAAVAAARAASRPCPDTCRILAPREDGRSSALPSPCVLLLVLPRNTSCCSLLGGTAAASVREVDAASFPCVLLPAVEGVRRLDDADGGRVPELCGLGAWVSGCGLFRRGRGSAVLTLQFATCSDSASAATCWPQRAHRESRPACRGGSLTPSWSDARTDAM
jgi:hypothetical protein